MALMTKAALYSRIDSMRRKYGIEGVLDPLAFAAEKGIFISLHRFDDDNLRGTLVRVPGSRRSIIALDARLTEAERRFIVAHELVHNELHGAYYTGLEAVEAADRFREYQAEEGAAELLLPYRDFIPRACALRGLFHCRPGLALESLAARYGVNREYARRRLYTLGCELRQYAAGTPLEKIRLISLHYQAEAGLIAPPLWSCALPARVNADVWCDE